MLDWNKLYGCGHHLLMNFSFPFKFCNLREITWQAWLKQFKLFVKNKVILFVNFISVFQSLISNTLLYFTIRSYCAAPSAIMDPAPKENHY